MSVPISITGVTRSYGQTVALSPTTIEIAGGEFVSLIGPSGCGKTTLLRIVADLETPTRGTVLIGDDTPAQARKKLMLGLVSQRSSVLPWKRAIDDVRFTQAVTGRAGFEARGLLRDFGLAEHENKYPRQLSGGMLQRVNFASAIAHDPSVILMDEPFSALDEMKREELGYWLGEELGKRPRTVLFVTHHIEEAICLADRILVFSPGPGRVVRDIRVPSPRPRHTRFRTSQEFVEIGNQIRELLFSRGSHAA